MKDNVAAISEANSKAGPRNVPAKVLPVPSDVDAQIAEAIAATYATFAPMEELDTK